MSLATHLAANTVFAVVDLLHLHALDGRDWYWTAAAADVTTTIDGGSITFKANGPLVSRPTSRRTAGLEIDTLTVKLGAGALVLASDGRLITKAATDGVFNGGRVRLWKLVWGPGGVGDDSLGALLRFSGPIANVKPYSTRVILTVKSEVDRLSTSYPPNVYQPSCPLALYSVPCGVTKASFTAAVTVGASPTATVIPASSAVAGHKLGVLTFRSVAGGGGANAGLRRMVASVLSAPARLVLNVPLPVAPAAGDLADVTFGCDKTQSMCSVTFSNLPNFKGAIYVPGDK